MLLTIFGLVLTLLAGAYLIFLICNSLKKKLQGNSVYAGADQPFEVYIDFPNTEEGFEQASKLYEQLKAFIENSLGYRVYNRISSPGAVTMDQLKSKIEVKFLYTMREAELLRDLILKDPRVEKHWIVIIDTNNPTVWLERIYGVNITVAPGSLEGIRRELAERFRKEFGIELRLDTPAVWYPNLVSMPNGFMNLAFLTESEAKKIRRWCVDMNIPDDRVKVIHYAETN
jgi:hypothetical protein